MEPHNSVLCLKIRSALSSATLGMQPRKIEANPEVEPICSYLHDWLEGRRAFDQTYYDKIVAAIPVARHYASDGLGTFKNPKMLSQVCECIVAALEASQDFGLGNEIATALGPEIQNGFIDYPKIIKLAILFDVPVELVRRIAELSRDTEPFWACESDSLLNNLSEPAVYLLERCAKLGILEAKVVIDILAAAVDEAHNRHRLQKFNDSHDELKMFEWFFQRELVSELGHHFDQALDQSRQDQQNLGDLFG